MKQQTTIRIEEDLYERVKLYCSEYGYSFSGLISVLLRERIKDEKN